MVSRIHDRKKLMFFLRNVTHKIFSKEIVILFYQLFAVTFSFQSQTLACFSTKAIEKFYPIS